MPSRHEIAREISGIIAISGIGAPVENVRGPLWVARIADLILGHLWLMYAVYWMTNGHPWCAGACGTLGVRMIL